MQLFRPSTTKWLRHPNEFKITRWQQSKSQLLQHGWVCVSCSAVTVGVCLQEAAGKPRINMVVVGHVDAGKSTMMGRLLVDLGQVVQALPP